MEKSIQKVIPSSDLLQEMDELQILGGTEAVDVDVYFLSKCTVTTYSGNCVAGCGCSVDPVVPVTPGQPVPVN